MATHEGIYKADYIGLLGAGNGGLIFLRGIISGLMIGVKIGGSFKAVADGIEADLAAEATEDFHAVTGVFVEKGTRPIGKVRLSKENFLGEPFPISIFDGEVVLRLTRLGSL